MLGTRTNRVAMTALFATALLVAPFSPLLAEGERWFHVHVSEEGEEIRVNLPLTLIEKAIELMPESISEEVRVELNESDFDVEDLREMWNEVRNSPDATFVTVESEDETVKVRKEGEYFVARTVERSADGASVDVKFPLEVVDALFSGGEGELDLAAAVRALASYEGDMVTVEEPGTRVRIWVDGQNESE